MVGCPETRAACQAEAKLGSWSTHPNLWNANGMIGGDGLRSEIAVMMPVLFSIERPISSDELTLKAISLFAKKSF